ncbi:MAG: phosphodiester glycosidase family protein [Verrucomicrobiota bacterium]
MRLLSFTYIVLTCISPLAGFALEKQVIDGVTYSVMQSQPEQVEIFWKNPDGKQLRTIPAVAKDYKKRGVEIEVIMNGGIFEPGGIPSGLLVQNGKELNPINRKEGEGNFYLKPNGIFVIHQLGASVIRTEEYPVADTHALYAVQSGPLLLRNGSIHPIFKADSKYRLHRNGIGVTKSRKVILAITDINSPKFPNLYEFAQLFKKLGCDDALFLDGDISQMKTGADALKPSNGFGSYIIVKPKK